MSVSRVHSAQLNESSHCDIWETYLFGDFQIKKFNSSVFAVLAKAWKHRRVPVLHSENVARGAN